MLTLAFESSAKAASAALLEDERLVCQAYQCSGLTHSRTLLPMAESMLQTAGISLSQIDRFAVACGPGSFTGIRIGVSAVKGLAWGAEKPCVGVSTLAAMAWNGAGAGGPVCPVMDARRSEVYNALFRVENGRPVRLCPDRAISLEKLAEEITAIYEADRESPPVFLTGDGAAITASYLSDRGIAFRLAPENLRWQTAWGVGMEAKGLPDSTPELLLPVYLRLSQAERERQAKMKE